MSQDDSLSERYRSHVADLAGALDAGDEAAFRGAFERCASSCDVELNPELQTHHGDRAVGAARASAPRRASTRSPTMKCRMRASASTHVVKLTDEAAHRTLDLVEQSGPLVERTARESAQLLEEWAAAWLARAGRRIAVARTRQ